MMIKYMSNIIVYNVMPIKNTQTAKITPIGSYNTKTRSHLPDIPLKVIKLNNDIMCEILKCNITHHFMAANLKLPVIRLTVLYNRKITVTKLMSIYLYFTITDKIKSKEQLLTNKHNGVFTIETDINNEKMILSQETEFKSEDDIMNKLEALINDTDMKELIGTLKNDTEVEIREIYSKQWKDIQEDIKKYVN